jgi:hypothetical protein
MEEFGKTDTQIIMLVLNKSEANAIIDNICDAEEAHELYQATRQLRAILAPVAGITTRLARPGLSGEARSVDQ